MSRTTALAEWVAAAKYRDFPEDTITQAKCLILKALVGMLVGSREPIAKILTTYFAEKGGAPEAGVVAAGFRTSVENAAYANGTFAHASELEDNELPNVTSSYWMFPALFALAEKHVSSGRELIESAIISWEVASRFCRAAPGWLSMTKFHLPPGSWFGTVGVAAAAAKLLKLNCSQTEHALAIAGSFSSGLGQPGSDTHFLETGHTCQTGLQSALLAAAGATGELGVLETSGFYASIWSEGKVNLEIIDAGLGKPPYLINQAYIKKYSACTFTHCAIDALALLMEEHAVTYDEVEYVEAQLSDFSLGVVGIHPQPADLQEARFSIEYLLAEVLLRRKVDVYSFVGEERLSDPKHKEAEGKVRKSLLPPDSASELQSAQVILAKKNGEQFVKRLDGWIGSPQHPLTAEQVREVCRPYLEVMLDKGQCGRVEQLVLNLEQQPDILEVMEILTFSRVGHRIQV